MYFFVLFKTLRNSTHASIYNVQNRSMCSLLVINKTLFQNFISAIWEMNYTWNDVGTYTLVLK